MKKSTDEASNVSGLVPCIRVTLETMHDSARRGVVKRQQMCGTLSLGLMKTHKKWLGSVGYNPNIPHL